MNRIANAARSFLPAFLAGLCLTVALNQVNFLTTRPTADSVTDSALQSNTGYNASKARIFCWIMVPFMMPLMSMMVINDTWGPRCDGFAFVAPKIAVGAVKLSVIDVNIMLYDFRRFHQVEWKRIWLSAWQLHRDKATEQFDYFLLLRTGNYLIVENLRHLLRNRDPDQLFMTGRRMQQRLSYQHQTASDQGSSEDDYLASDAGILLSKGAFVAMVTRGFAGTSSNEITRRYCGSESVTLSYDTQLSKCLKSVGVQIVDSRDRLGRERFHPVHPSSLLQDSLMPAWLKLNSYYRPVRACISCPSPESVTFFGVSEFYKFDAMVYEVGPSLAAYKQYA